MTLNAQLKLKIWLGVAAAVVIVASLGGWWLAFVRLNDRRVIIPQDVAQKAAYPLYEPTRLPKGYSLDPHSFTFKDGALLFSVSDAEQHHIVFAEQAMPKDFDFKNFYQLDVGRATTLQDVPYTTVVGTVIGGNQILSITTGVTWLIITTEASVSMPDMQLIATNIQPL